ncbi:MAG: hypothetical protein CVV07_03070 [Gammaproteobacteria bacterium HGW-Gammaproteobacteria-11]|nr:MAG: hypothetical protein CVV07_03070 [Gammaproteobacteria bacterium HGW-Gammaproteobacteria-11]
MPTLSSADACPCGSGKGYGDCCQPLHQGQPAANAEALMRSRYCAYSLGLVDYLQASTLPAQQQALDLQAMASWSHSSRWLGLQINSASPCPPGTDRAQVTFTAQWADADGQSHSHQECSDFLLRQGHWYFVDPNHRLKAGRNDPCPCSSGRKFKHCCA